MDRVVLPNALLDREVYPFLFQERASALSMADAIRKVLSDGKADQRAASDARTLWQLLRGGADSFEAGVVAAMTEWLGPPSR